MESLQIATVRWQVIAGEINKERTAHGLYQAICSALRDLKEKGMAGREFKNSSRRISLFLFGGGHRAMLFHLGALQRLNEFGLLGKLSLISSVSGGSIVAGTLAANWTSLNFDSNGVARKFDELVPRLVRKLASTNLESPWRIAVMSRKKWITNPAPSRYQELVGKVLLAELPKQPGQPEFVFKATNLQTGGMWSFSRSRIGDRFVGEITDPRLELATVIAASACLPPEFPVVLNPASIGDWTVAGADRFKTHEFRNRIILCDGSASWEPDFLPTSAVDITLVSDAGALYNSGPRPSLHWLNSRFSALTLSDVHTYERRKREWPVKLGKLKLTRAYWDISNDIKEYGAKDALECPPERTKGLAEVRTGFAAIDDAQQNDLIDWGFASCDAAVRASLGEFELEIPDSSPNGSFYRKAPAAGAATAA